MLWPHLSSTFYLEMLEGLKMHVGLTGLEK